MTFGTLVFTAFSRNPLRSVFTFVAIAAGFCLFGALETNLYQRELPPADADTVIAQLDSNTLFPLDSERQIASLKGVHAAVGLMGVAAQNPKTATQPLFVMGLNPALLPQTLPGLGISAETARRWSESRIGALCDEQTAREMGWHVNDHITLALMPGQLARGENAIQLDLVGLYRTGSLLSGLIMRTDYMLTAFPQTAGFGNFFVKPERASEARVVAQRVDDYFRGGPSESITAPISDFREAASKDAATIRLMTLGALAISFFTMVLIVANALMQSVRERTGEMAVMRALGFQQQTLLVLVLGEALTLFAAGAVLGLVVSNLGFTFEIAGTLRHSSLLPLHTVVAAAMYVVLFAGIAALLPCWEIWKLRVADALARL